MLRINNKGKVLGEKNIMQLNNIYCADLLKMGADSYVIGGHEKDDSEQKNLWIHEFRF